VDAREHVLQLAQHPADAVCVLPDLSRGSSDPQLGDFDANWVGTTRADCTKEGACWVFIQQRFGQFMYGYYPTELRWRVDLTVWLAVIGAAPLFISRVPRKAVYGLSFLVLYPIIAWSPCCTAVSA
jgi:hypothetical protein